MHKANETPESKGVTMRPSASHLNKLYYTLLLCPLPLYFCFAFVFSDVSAISELVFGPAGWIIVAWLPVIFFAHEILHVIAFIGGGVSRRNLTPRIDFSSLSFELAIDQKITIRLWRISLLAPCVILNPAIAWAGIEGGAGSPAWLILAFSVSGCAYDIAVYAGLAGIPGTIKVYPRMKNVSGTIHVEA